MSNGFVNVIDLEERNNSTKLQNPQFAWKTSCGPFFIGESVRGNRIGATRLRASERKSASERVSERTSEREGFQRFLRGF